MTQAIPTFPSHRRLSEPGLLFHPERHEDVHVHPLMGLLEHGPYSRSLLNTVMDPIRIASVVPDGASARITDLLAELRGRHSPRERRAYLPEFPGFGKIFGLRAVEASPRCRLKLSDTLDEVLSRSGKPHEVLAEELVRALGAAASVRSEFDVLMVYLPARWGACYEVADRDGFDLHDFVKAAAASRGIPVQILREDKAFSYRCRCSVMWRLSIAIYCKAGGVPWKLAAGAPDTAHMGISYALGRASGGGPAFVTCCSQVFDADGAGLEFVAYNADPESVARGNPFLSRADMRRVMARSLRLYQRRHGGRVPSHIYIHKSTEFKPDEVDGCFDALRAVEHLDLIQIQQDPCWRGVSIERPRRSGTGKGSPGNYPVERGTYVWIDERDVLLWTSGNAPSAVGQGNFYKEGKGIPRPLLLRRYAGHGAWDEACQATLGLTKMNWNHDGLYDRLPVTLGYASVLARTIKRMPKLADRPYQFRFFM